MLSLSRREFMVLTGATAAAGALGPIRAAVPPSVFPYGTHVYREPPLPLEQLAADLPLLKRLGFSMIKIQESWSTDEKHRGEIDLSHVERVVADARGSGLMVYFGVTMEQAPAWLWRQYPDATMLYEDGSPQNDPTQYLLPGDGKPGPCWHHPEARRAAEHFIEAVGQRLGRYDNIAVWNVWQEIGLNTGPGTTRPGHRYLCYCPHSLEAYRTWLRSRYKSLDELNSKWRTAFDVWEEVQPPRLFSPVPSMIDWRIFMEDVYLSEVLRWKGDAFRRSDPLKRPILAHTPGPTWGSTADWQYAATLDIYGCSFYPSWGEAENLDVSPDQRVRTSDAPLEQLWDGVMMRMDYTRSASSTGRVWTAELEGGRAGGGLTPGRVPDPGDIRRWVLGNLAAGARGICFWNHRNEVLWSETSGFGLLDRKGDTTARAEEAGRLGRAIQAQANLFVEGRTPTAQVGILVGERLYQFLAASEPEEIKTQSVQTIRGLYKGLWRAGIPVDFVDAQTFAAGESQPHKVLILPAPLSLSSTLAEHLREFVRKGGTLISEACPGRFDEYGLGRADEMAPGFAELFGAEHERLASLSTIALPGSDANVAATAPVLDGVGELAGHRVATSLYVQTLKPHTAHPILVHKEYCVACSNSFGSGRAVLIGTLLGKGILADHNDNETVLVELVKAAGVKPDVVGRLLRRTRVSGTTEAWFLINPTHEPVREALAVAPGKAVSDLLTGPLAPRGGELMVEVGALDIKCLIVR